MKKLLAILLALVLALATCSAFAEAVDPDSNAMLNATLKIILFRMLVWFFFYNGMLPCFLAGLLSFFVANMFNALITRKRVLRGSITSSI